MLPYTEYGTDERCSDHHTIIYIDATLFNNIKPGVEESSSVVNRLYRDVLSSRCYAPPARTFPRAARPAVIHVQIWTHQYWASEQSGRALMPLSTSAERHDALRSEILARPLSPPPSRIYVYLASLPAFGATLSYM